MMVEILDSLVMDVETAFLYGEIGDVFSVKIQHNLTDYLGCEFHMSKEKTRGWLGQPVIYHQKSRTKIWTESNERKIVSNTWISKIHRKKAREPRGQSEF